MPIVTKFGCAAVLLFGDRSTMILNLVATAAAATFDLICAGTTTAESPGRSTREQYSETYRIDLNRAIYCLGDCKSTRPIAAIDPAVLTIWNDDSNPPWVSMNEIDRQTGKQTISESSGTDDFILIRKSVGHCERAPFTGFPTFETKF